MLFSHGVSGVVGVTVCVAADVEVYGVRVVATVCGVRIVATVCGVWVVATVCGVWVALEVRVCVVQVVAEDAGRVGGGRSPVWVWQSSFSTCA